MLETIITEAILFLSGFSFTDIHDSQDNRGRESLSLSLTALYHFHLLHRHLDISQAITAESSPIHIASSRTWTRNLFFPRCKLLTTKLCRKQLFVSVFKFSFYLTPNLHLKSKFLPATVSKQTVQSKRWARWSV